MFLTTQLPCISMAFEKSNFPDLVVRLAMVHGLTGSLWSHSVLFFLVTNLSTVFLAVVG